MGEWLGLLLWLALAAGAPPQLAIGGDATRLWPRPWEVDTVYRPAARAVSGWRLEATRWLEAAPLARARYALGDGAELPRCVRLANYWCIKRAGWAGEIAADAQGHVAFASARDGAIVAAGLLRRYYVDYGRKTATAIVTTWAPAECGVASAIGGQRLAARGLNNTLRGRWLARNRPGFTGARFAGRRGGVRRSVVANAPPPMLRAPSIAAGMGERAGPVARLAALDLVAPAPPGRAPAAPVASCASERQRQANYAGRIGESVGLTATDDLGLFDAAGEPTDRLPRVLIAMAAVEIGPHAISPQLADEAIEGLRELLRKRREAAAAAAAAPVQAPAP